MFIANLLAVPAWAWWLIAAVAAIALITLIVVVILGSAKRKNGNSGEKAERKTEKAQKQEVTSNKKEKEEKPKKVTEEKPEQAKGKKVYHISKRKEDGMWQIKAAGGEKAIKLFKTQKEAIDYCKTLADNQDASIMIHKEDGSFRKLTY